MGLFSNMLGNAGSVSPDKLQEEYGKLLAEGERIEIGFNIFRDVFMFTNRRLLLVDKQGLTGRKVEYISIAYKSISKYVIETAGTLDLDAELKIYISTEKEPSIQKKFDSSVDVYALQRVLAQHTMK